MPTLSPTSPTRTAALPSPIELVRAAERSQLSPTQLAVALVLREQLEARHDAGVGSREDGEIVYHADLAALIGPRRSDAADPDADMTAVSRACEELARRGLVRRELTRTLTSAGPRSTYCYVLADVDAASTDDCNFGDELLRRLTEHLALRRELTPVGLAIIARLAVRADARGRVVLPRSELSSATGLDPKTALKHLRALEAAGGLGVGAVSVTTAAAEDAAGLDGGPRSRRTRQIVAVQFELPRALSRAEQRERLDRISQAHTRQAERRSAKRRRSKADLEHWTNIETLPLPHIPTIEDVPTGPVRSTFEVIFARFEERRQARGEPALSPATLAALYVHPVLSSIAKWGEPAVLEVLNRMSWGDRLPENFAAYLRASVRSEASERAESGYWRRQAQRDAIALRQDELRGELSSLTETR